MSRIRGIEPKPKKEILPSVKKKNEPDTACEKNDVEKDQIKDMLDKIPRLAKNFKVHRKIGEGTFSCVYLASLRQDSSKPDAEKRWYAVKHLVPVPHPIRVAHELHCLRDIGGTDHVIGVEWCLRHMENTVFVMPYMPHKKFTEYLGDMDAAELRGYMRALLTALRHVHTFGVIHRDVKPSNFLYDRERRRYALVDFGLAQHMVPSAPAQPPPAEPPPAHQPLKRARDDDSILPPAKRAAVGVYIYRRIPFPPPNQSRRTPLSPPPAHAPPARSECVCAGLGGVCTECVKWAAPRANRAGTQGFRPPEVLLKYPHQTTAVDVWAAGVILASLLTGRYPFFQPEDDLSAVAELASYLGTSRLERAANALGCRFKMSMTRRGVCLRKMAAYQRAGRSHLAAAKRGPHCEECKAPKPLCFCRESPECELDPARAAAGHPDSAFALAALLLEPNPADRISAADALRHPFFSESCAYGH